MMSATDEDWTDPADAAEPDTAQEVRALEATRSGSEDGDVRSGAETLVSTQARLSYASELICGPDHLRHPNQPGLKRDNDGAHDEDEAEFLVLSLALSLS